MPIFALFVTAAKLVGVLATVTVTANAISFSLYRKKNLKPFKSPIDESAEILASFNLNEGEDEFFFGLATAPAHVEDRLNDAWLQFAEENPCDKSQPNEGMETADVLMGSAAGDGGSQPASDF
ncbi:GALACTOLIPID GALACTOSYLTRANSFERASE SFR2 CHLOROPLASTIC [Salix viminalis]|uniref:GALACTOLIPID GALACTOSYLTRANSFERASE SFR2 CHLOROPLASTIC n=1 Tax=Salix viminalis TaxID=40686 RepID=A0A9Q0U026_SALVM|nr:GALACTOLIPID GALACTOSYLTRANSFERASE SFR2 CHLOROPLASTIC [Salix viminalis]